MADPAAENVPEVAHASVRTYLVICAILIVVTLMEVGCYYIQALHERFWLLFSILALLSAGKFALVVGYYMHLRYDAHYYRRVFVVPLAIAVAITAILAVLTAARYLA